MTTNCLVPTINSSILNNSGVRMIPGGGAHQEQPSNRVQPAQHSIVSISHSALSTQHCTGATTTHYCCYASTEYKYQPTRSSPHSQHTTHS